MMHFRNRWGGRRAPIDSSEEPEKKVSGNEWLWQEVPMSYGEGMIEHVALDTNTTEYLGYAVHEDWQNTVWALSNTSAVVVERYVQDDPFGKSHTLDASGNDLGNFASQVHHYKRMHGGVVEPVTGLYDFRNRWYSPESGAWLSRDPLGAVDSPNLYQAFLSNPLGLEDSFGASVTYSRWQASVHCRSALGSSVSKRARHCILECTRTKTTKVTECDGTTYYLDGGRGCVPGGGRTTEKTELESFHISLLRPGGIPPFGENKVGKNQEDEAVAKCKNGSDSGCRTYQVKYSQGSIGNLYKGGPIGEMCDDLSGGAPDPKFEDDDYRTWGPNSNSYISEILKSADVYIEDPGVAGWGV